MNANTQQLHALGQSLWIDNITRQMLDDGTLERYIAELSITGLTSNPTTFEHAIGKGSAYDDQIAALAREGRSGEDLFFQLALRDLTRAVDFFRPVHDATGGVDGWVSLEISPLIVDDADETIKAFAEHGKVGAPMTLDGGDAEAVIAELRALGVGDSALADRLQREGGDAFAKSWKSLLVGIADKTSQLNGAPAR